MYTNLRHKSIVSAVAFALLVTTTEDGTLTLWDTATWKEKHVLAAYKDAVNALAVTKDGKLIATGGLDKTLKLWDAATGKELASLPNQKGRVLALAFSPDGKQLASSACEPFEKGEVKLWDVAQVLQGGR